MRHTLKAPEVTVKQPQPSGIPYFLFHQKLVMAESGQVSVETTDRYGVPTAW